MGAHDRHRPQQRRALELEFLQLGTVVDRRIDTVDQYTDRDEMLVAAGLTPAGLSAG